MRFFRYTTPLDHAVYGDLDNIIRRDLRHFRGVAHQWTPNLSLSGDDGITGKWLIVNVTDIPSNANFRIIVTPSNSLLRDGRLRESGAIVRLVEGFNALYIPDNVTLLRIFAANPIQISGLVVVEELGVLSTFHSISARTRANPKMYTAINRIKFVVNYDERLELTLTLNGAPSTDADVLTDLQFNPRFWLWANGGNPDGFASWAKRDVFRPCVVGSFSGWNGGSGRAIGGAFGKMTFVETARYLTSDDVLPNEITPANTLQASGDTLSCDGETLTC